MTIRVMSASAKSLFKSGRYVSNVHFLCLDYRSHSKEGRFLYKVGTLRNFANDLLRKIIITTLIL